MEQSPVTNLPESRGLDRTFMVTWKPGDETFAQYNCANCEGAPRSRFEVSLEAGVAEPKERRSGAVDRMRILETVTTLETAARNLRQLAGAESWEDAVNGEEAFNVGRTRRT